MSNMIIVTVFALSIFCFFIVYFSPFNKGGGKTEHSPDGIFVADAMSIRNATPFAGHDVFGEFRVRNKTNGQQIASLRLYPSVQIDEMGYRNAAQVVWSDDSRKVTFIVPEGEFTINVDKY